MIQQAVIAIDLGGTNVRAAIINDQGAILTLLQEPTQIGTEPLTLVEQLADLARKLQSQSDPALKPAALGLGAPGPLSSTTGVIFSAPNIPTWHELPIAELLVKRTSLPVFLINDADAAALGEYWQGIAKGADNFVYITLGTGIGSGLVLNGSLWTGTDGIGAEFGHITIDPDGPECGCGNRGCLEAFASATAIRKIISETYSLRGRATTDLEHEPEPPRDLADLAILAEAGDQDALTIFATAGKYLGIGVASLANLLNLEMAVLGGGMSGAARFFMPSMETEIRRRAFARQAASLKLRVAERGSSAGLLGVAKFCFDRLAAIPL